MPDLTNFFLTHEPIIRLSAFAGVFTCVAVWETARPFRHRLVSRWFRWSNNAALLIINSVLVRFLFPAAAVGFARWAEANDIGLMNWIDGPGCCYHCCYLTLRFMVSMSFFIRYPSSGDYTECIIPIWIWM